MKTIGKHMKTIGVTTRFKTGFTTVDMVLIVWNIIVQGARNHTRIHTQDSYSCEMEVIACSMYLIFRQLRNGSNRLQYVHYLPAVAKWK